MWLIIGYGSLLRQDDGAGYRVAEQLAMQLTSQDVRILAIHQLIPELALELAGEDVERVLFIDAQRDQTKLLVMGKLDPAAARGSCGHHLTPALLLNMTRSLYQRSPRGWLLTLAAQQMEMGEMFSATVQTAIPTALTLVKKILAKTVN